MGYSTFLAQETLYYFISVGEDKKLFTLRRLDKGTSVEQGQIIKDSYSFHVKNLGADLHAAITKGEAFAHENGKTLKVSDEIKSTQLFDIKRFSQEELKNKKLEAEQKRQDSLKAKHDELKAIKFDLDGKVNFGKYRDLTVKELIKNKPDYIHYIMDNMSFPIEYFQSYPDAFFTWLLDSGNVPAKREINTRSNWLSHAGDTISVLAQCTDVRRYSKTVNYGVTVVTRIYSMEDDNGNLIQVSYSGNKWVLDIGNTYMFTAKVKGHFEKEGQKVTMLFYVNKLVQLDIQKIER